MTNACLKAAFPRVRSSITAVQTIRTHTPSISTRTYASNAMSDIKIQVGDAIPQGTFTYIPYSPELEDHSACGIRT